MTITGKVFLFLTLILAIVFPALAQPVFEYNHTNQKIIAAETAKLNGNAEEKKIGLLQEITDLERKRKQYRDLTALEERRRMDGEQRARELRLMKEVEISFLRDALEDSEIRAKGWRSSLSQTESEINARDAEIKEMDTEVQQAKADGLALSKQVTDLKAKLENSRSERQRLSSELKEREKDLAAIMKKQPDVPDDDVALSNR
jgi:chromosome segregation ATPase